DNLTGVSGRLEPVGTVSGASVIVDYAHKPEALEAALRAVRPFATGRLICVFGCGGDRDAGKRPIMGEIASRGADHVIVTDDNPRTEAPRAIRKAILDAAPGATEIGDRAEAIQAAIDMARDGDVVLIAGKGHETGQIVGDEVLPFSDQAVAREAIATRSSVSSC
ncbi:MAG: cyanophycin synthetase, partial [Pseudomonadota bacterium]